MEPYTKLQKDPTERIKREARSKLEILGDNGTIDQSLYFKLKLTDFQAPRFYGLPKIHKASIPVRPMVSYSGSPLFNLSKHITNIVKSYTLLNKQHCKNSKEFSEFIRTHTKEDDEIMVLFDVEALCTNVSIEDALAIIKELLENDETLSDQTPLSPKNVLDLCNFYHVQHSSFSMARTTNRQKALRWEDHLYSCRNLHTGNRNDSFNNN